MIKIETILCPVDFSETSDHALEYARELAARLSARVVVTHVCQLPSYALSDGFVPPVEFQEQYRSRLVEKLDDLVSRHSGKEVEISGELIEGVPHNAILNCIKETGADLVVMGTHGRTGLSHALLGSVTERVVRTANVPVLTLCKPH